MSQPWDGRNAHVRNRSRRHGADSDGRSVLRAGPGQPSWLRHSPVSTRARSLWLGTDCQWSEERDVGQENGWNGLKAQTYGEPGRHGQWAKSLSLGTLIPITRVIGMNGVFSGHVSDPF